MNEHAILAPRSLREPDFHHSEDADPARDAARTIRTSDELPDVAGTGSQVISMFVAGPVAEKIGIPNLYYASAAMLVGIGVVGYFKLPKAEKAEAEKAESAKTG